MDSSDLHSPVDVHQPRRPEIRLRLSRAVLHASQHKRERYFRRVTDAHREDIDALLQAPPLFYDRNPEATQRIALLPEWAARFPSEFFADPTGWIEAQPNIERHHDPEKLPAGQTIAELWKTPYDISKVKNVTVEPQGQTFHCVAKRLEPLRHSEFERHQRAESEGIPTPRVIGSVEDEGNFYLLMEHVPALSLFAVQEKAGLDHAYMIGTPYCITDFKAFKNFMASSKYMEFISPEGRARLQAYWAEYRDDIVSDEIANMVRDTMERYMEAVDMWPELAEILDKRGFTGTDLDRMAELLGHKNFQEMFEAQSMSVLRARLIHLRKQLKSERLSPFERKWVSKVVEEVYHTDPLPEIKRLEALCREKGIEHKDLDLRNILIKWDFEKAKPTLDEDGKPGLLLIDWEERPHLPWLEKRPQHQG